jgi:hypothetical protein
MAKDRPRYIIVLGDSSCMGLDSTNVIYHVYHVCPYSNSDIVASGSDHRLLATVTFEYSSQQEGELSLRVGDVINDVTEVTSRARGVILYLYCQRKLAVVAEMDSYDVRCMGDKSPGNPSPICGARRPGGV